MPESLPLSYNDVCRAAERLRGVANHTPVMTSRTLDATIGRQVFFKCENFQRSGAFKFRGAYNRLSLLTDGEKQHGIVAYSTGNHAQATALAAKLLEVQTVVPIHYGTFPILAGTPAELEAEGHRIGAGFKVVAPERGVETALY